MAESSAQKVTQLLQAWSAGDQEALNQLTPLVEAELHRLARIQLRGERAGHTLQTTALVNEAYLRLTDWQNISWQNRAHFFAIAAQMMRRVLVDYARRRSYQKRGGNAIRVTLSEAENVSTPQDADLIALNDALSELEKFDPRRSRIVELKFFAGLETAEIAEVLSVPQRTIAREWQLARAWLFLQLSQ